MRRLLVLSALLGLAFALRIVRLDAVPLRGDEAFAVRYWANPPAQVARELADWEPHPFGTFLSFWAWKNAAGDSEFAMRYLSLLGNWIGVAAVAALARQVWRDTLSPYVAAGLWAINPFQIWHAQDARNYALWAGFSALAMWRFLRAADSNARRDWTLYLLTECVALYLFFLEAFLLAVQAAYLLLIRPARPVLRRAALVWLILALPLIPWFAQIWLLSNSGYEGTTGQAAPGKLLTWFLPALLTGEDALQFPWSLLFLAGTLALIVLIIADTAHSHVLWLAAWIAVPTALLMLATTRMSVFHPRYLIAITPALLILIARAARPGNQPPSAPRYALVAPRVALLIIPLLGLNALVGYYRGDHPKAANWPALTAYLEHRARPGDLIVQAVPDPAFGYYYRGGAEEMSLVPGANVDAQLRPEVNFFRAIWLVGRSPDAETFLQNRMQPVSFHDMPGFPIMQFRGWEPDPNEIVTPLSVTFGDIARLVGYTIQGPDPAMRAITVLLYWEPLAQADIDYTVFVHLIGPPHPGPLWDQEDHRPLYGFASALAWEVGALYRDPYHLLENPALALAPGEYAIEVGFYDPATNKRLIVLDSDGSALGDSYTLLTLRWPIP